MFAVGPIKFGNGSSPAADFFVQKVVMFMDFHGYLGFPGLILKGFRCFQLGSHHLPICAHLQARDRVDKGAPDLAFRTQKAEAPAVPLIFSWAVQEWGCRIPQDCRFHGEGSDLSWVILEALHLQGIPQSSCSFTSTAGFNMVQPWKMNACADIEMGADDFHIWRGKTSRNTQ